MCGRRINKYCNYGEFHRIRTWLTLEDTWHMEIQRVQAEMKKEYLKNNRKGAQEHGKGTDPGRMGRTDGF